MAFNPKFTITPKINKALVEIEPAEGDGTPWRGQI